MRRQLELNDIKTYNFPATGENDEGQEALVPFAVVSSNTVTVNDGREVRGREYPWGTVNIEDKVRLG